MTQLALASAATSDFPYQLKDLEGWVVKKKNGTVVRYTIEGNRFPKNQSIGYSAPRTNGYTQVYGASLGRYCNHQPSTTVPIFEYGNIALYIADAAGARATQDLFDIIIDGGAAITPSYAFAVAKGEKTLVSLAQEFAYEPASHPYDLLQIQWTDRAAPPLRVDFWPSLAIKLADLAIKREEEGKGPLKVLTVCQGGHGRSGTALTALMMCLSSYSSLDAITHLRAVHCPRAIESTVQHGYLNALAVYLGREANANEADKVTDFRTRFLAMTQEEAKPYQARLSSAKHTKDEVTRYE